MRMIDVGGKRPTQRVAIARGFLRMSEATQARLFEGKLEKGDALAAARLAGVMAAKRTPDLIPLCHPIALSGVEVEVARAEGGVAIEATVRTTDRTGVEMEALAAVSAAALTLYDMLKRHERGMSIERVELMEKRGGRTGTWKRVMTRTSRSDKGSRSLEVPMTRMSRSRKGSRTL